MRPTFLLLALSLTLSCGDDSEAFDCAANAIDECDQQACEEACGDCAGDCLILESYPPQYACEDGETLDVYSVCPDWTMDTGS